MTPANDPEILGTRWRNSESEFVPGTTLYLGHYARHYGHFVLESLSSLWPSPIPQFDQVAFHPFVFGTEIVEYARLSLACFGISPEKVRFIRSGTFFERVILPERATHLNVSTHVDMRPVYNRIVDCYARKRSACRLFLSRSSLPQAQCRNPYEKAIEDLFTEKGFVIVSPEKLSFSEQISLFSSAAVIAGSSGSALHNILFAKKGTILIDVLDKRSPAKHHPSQQLCNLLSEPSAFAVPYGLQQIDTARKLCAELF